MKCSVRFVEQPLVAVWYSLLRLLRIGSGDCTELTRFKFKVKLKRVVEESLEVFDNEAYDCFRCSISMSCFCVRRASDIFNVCSSADFESQDDSSCSSTRSMICLSKLSTAVLCSDRVCKRFSNSACSSDSCSF